MDLTLPGFLDVYDLRGWQIKAYGVADAARPRAALLAAARRVVTGSLPARPDLDGAFGLGFLIVHDTAGSCQARIHWWVRPDKLHQRAFGARPDQPRGLAPLPGATIGGLPGLAVIEHERRAWLCHVLDCPAGPDLDAYLTDVLR